MPCLGVWKSQLMARPVFGLALQRPYSQDCFPGVIARKCAIIFMHSRTSFKMSSDGVANDIVVFRSVETFIARNWLIWKITTPILALLQDQLHNEVPEHLFHQFLCYLEEVKSPDHCIEWSQSPRLWLIWVPARHSQPFGGVLVVHHAQHTTFVKPHGIDD